MYLLLLSVLVVALDQLTKYYVVHNFSLGESVPVIENIFHWTYILNPGAAFGMFEGSRWIFVFIAISIIIALFYYKKEIMESDWWTRYGVALFVGGAFGNVIDRIRQGLVIDFFDFRIWPVFNVADIAICCGVGMIIWSIMTTEVLSKKE